MRRQRNDAEYVEFVDARRAACVRTAYLLCGDWHRAEDLVQQAMVKLYVAWPRLRRQGGEDAYVRRILVNAHLDDWRWRRRRPETSVPDNMDAPAVRPAATEDRDGLRRALAALPDGQRRVVVLRYWLDQSVDETAADLRISAGTVKSQSARGLARLRVLLGEDGEADNDGPKRARSTR